MKERFRGPDGRTCLCPVRPSGPSILFFFRSGVRAYHCAAKDIATPGGTEIPVLCGETLNPNTGHWRSDDEKEFLAGIDRRDQSV